MGQYYYPVNIRKKEFLYPHMFGDGLKLLEFGLSSYGTLTGLALLLADGNGRGGGDLYCNESAYVPEMVGHWVGDPIVIAGDYADPIESNTKISRWLGPIAKKFPSLNLYQLCNTPESGFRNISLEVLWAMWDDQSIRDEYDRSTRGNKARSHHEATIELMKLKKTPCEEWPLFIGKFKTEEVKNFYEQMLRKMKEVNHGCRSVSRHSLLGSEAET